MSKLGKFLQRYEDMKAALKDWQEFINLMSYDTDCKMNIGTAKQFNKAIEATKVAMAEESDE
jgi:hypothetical protein